MQSHLADHKHIHMEKYHSLYVLQYNIVNIVTY